MSAATRKLYETLRAKCALEQIALHEFEGDNGRPIYIVSRWALTKQLESLDEVEAWLPRVTGKPVRIGGAG